MLIPGLFGGHASFWSAPASSRAPSTAVSWLPVLLEAIACLAFASDLALVGGALHALAAAVAGFVSRRRVAPPDRAKSALATVLLVVALPLIGTLILSLVAWSAWASCRQLPTSGTIEIGLPGIGDADAPDAPPPVLPERPIREVLGDVRSASDRVQAVMALRTMDARRAVPLLRLAFTHHSEDIRLLAFAILERREKRLRVSIRTLERRLAILGDPLAGEEGEHSAARALCHRRLAQHYWELCYGGFVSGELETPVLERAARHALATGGGDAGSALLLARIHLRQRRATEAWQCLERADRAGAPRGSSAPLFAEAAYALRRFDEIPRLLGRVPATELCRPDLAQVAQFWTEPRVT